ncbi:PREDICTED: uncharacterized protein LOC108578077 [Habropoda laboriosa]|uniref:uncharacterized protein LOC108578077 n=1 Tax=Habropoda laboriosa TaxID=597456 RepID=UPI00083D2A6F|nr:PREDICTED: uncharacterized protein LOC108578077 [Habropoda laboriosa]
MAFKRFLALERQLDQNPQIKEQYSAFFKEYQQLGHMTIVSSKSLDGYFVPHHAVTKIESLTTKIRVVIDASAKTSSGISLNDALMVGPTVQDDLFTLISRFQTHQYVLTADITKMYRQIELSSEDRNYHKIFWREHRSQPLQTFVLNTVTYSTASAPFLATRILQQLARDEGFNHSIAAEVLQNVFYVDDLLTGASTFKEAEFLRDEIILLTTDGGFQLRQWVSNDSRLIEPLKNTDDEHRTLNLTDKKKTLGLFWQPQTDTIGYTVKEHDIPRKLTKRNILLRIVQLFDPLGLLCPIMVRAKLVMQELWKLHLHWDESVPFDIHSTWTEFQIQIPLIERFIVPRAIISKHAASVDVHGFSDSSERAYGSCLYLRTIDVHGNCSIRLICSKSRVAPVKTQSLPRLEFCASLLLANLCESITQAIKIKLSNITFWTDSMITLHWIRTPPHTLKQIVANRVSKIQQNSNIDQWRYVPSADNPADILSRGINPADFLKSKIWTNGTP